MLPDDSCMKAHPEGTDFAFKTLPAKSRWVHGRLHMGNGASGSPYIEHIVFSVS